MKAPLQHQPLIQPKTTTSSSGQSTASQPFFAKTGTSTLGQPETAPFFKSFVQTKLSVGRSDDRFEREADSTADRVMRMPAPAGSSSSFFPATGLLQTKVDEKEKKDIQRKVETEGPPVIRLKTDEEDKKKVQRKSESTAPPLTTGFESQLSASQSGGQPLSADTRQFMEPRFGADFSGVRVHTDAPAVQMSQSIGAQAFAYQNHVFFNEGKYNPGTGSGQHLLAHELTHVVQQGGSVQRKSVISTATPTVQRFFGLDVAGTIDGWLANLPGWRLLTVLAGYNPVLQREIPRSTTNLIEGFLTLGGPIGLLLFNKLRTEGIIGRVADWIDTQVAALGISYSYIRGLFSQAWDEMGISLRINGNLEVIRRVFATPFNRITAFVGRVITQVVVLIKETIVRPLSNRAKQMRGFPLLTVIIGKDPFTDEVVDRSPANLVRGFMSLMENGEERFQQMQQSGALQRAFTWFNVETARRNLTWERIKAVFVAVWNAITPEAVLHPLETIAQIVGMFTGLAMDLIGFAGAALLQLLEFIFEAVMGAGGARVLVILKRARATFMIIIRDPVRFVGNLVRAGVQGFRQFMQNAVTHLQRGLVSWMLGALEGAGLQLPQTFDLQGIMSLVLQILGITYQNIRAKLVRATSEQFVSRMEQVFDFLRILITQGPAAAWQKIVEYLGNLRNMVLDGVLAWVRQTVIGQAIIRIASMLNPAGAVIQAIMATYNTVMFFIERINQIAAVVESYVDSISAIAAGNIAAAANRVEATMGRMVPVIISFLARMMGLGGISNTITTTIARIRQPVDRALDGVVTWVVAQGRRLVGAGREMAGNLMGWWRTRRAFRTPSGENHSFFFQETGIRVHPMIASNPQNVITYLQNLDRTKLSPAQLSDLTEANRLALWLDEDVPRQEPAVQSTIQQLVPLLASLTPPQGAPDGSQSNPYWIKWHKKETSKLNPISVTEDIEQAAAPIAVQPLQRVRVTIATESPVATAALIPLRTSIYNLRRETNATYQHIGGLHPTDFDNAALATASQQLQDAKDLLDQMLAMPKNFRGKITKQRSAVRNLEGALGRIQNARASAVRFPQAERELGDAVTNAQSLWRLLKDQKTYTPQSESIGILPRNSVYEGAVLGPSVHGSPRNAQSKFREFLLEAGHNMTAQAHAADHVTELSLSGPDAFENLWPIPSFENVSPNQKIVLSSGKEEGQFPDAGTGGISINRGQFTGKYFIVKGFKL